MHSADMLLTSHSSVQDHRRLMQIFINLSAMAAVFANLDSSSMVEMLQLTRTLIFAPKKSIWLVPGFTLSEIMLQHLISLREQKQSDFRWMI